MKKNLKQLLMITLIGFLLAGLTLLLCLLDSEFQASLYVILSTVLTVIWTFFIPSSFMFVMNWVKDYFSRLTFEQSFRVGYYFGYSCGILLIFLFLAVSPITGIMWYVLRIKEIISFKKCKNYSSKNLNKVDD